MVASITRTRRIFIGSLLGFLILAAVIGAICIPNQAEKVEVTKTNIADAPSKEGPKIVKIGHILSSPEPYKGQAVVVEGEIISVCGSGCWFTLGDGTGTIYVDLAPSNLVIPQKRGAFARVYGKVAQKGSDTYLIGEKVEF